MSEDSSADRSVRWMAEKLTDVIGCSARLTTLVSVGASAYSSLRCTRRLHDISITYNVFHIHNRSRDRLGFPRTRQRKHTGNVVTEATGPPGLRLSAARRGAQSEGGVCQRRIHHGWQASAEPYSTDDDDGKCALDPDGRMVVSHHGLRGRSSTLKLTSFTTRGDWRTYNIRLIGLP